MTMVEIMRICGQTDELRKVRSRVGELARSLGFSTPDVGEIELAVDEALANVIRHGYGGPCDEPIEVTIEPTSGESAEGLRIIIRDYGKQVDPACIDGRVLDDVRPGGLGVHIIRSIMDEVHYATASGGGMRLTMFKKKAEK
jgi:serine/threonine-protein kinase RsbW